MPTPKVKKPVPAAKVGDCRICTLLNRDEHGRPIPTPHVKSTMHTDTVLTEQAIVEGHPTWRVVGGLASVA